MSLDIRYVTNGVRKLYVVRDAISDPMISFYDTIDDIPKSIRHYAEKLELTKVGPDLARSLHCFDVLYPDFPSCKLPSAPDNRCIAESCKLAYDGDYNACPYFDGPYQIR